MKKCGSCGWSESAHGAVLSSVPKNPPCGEFQPQQAAAPKPSVYECWVESMQAPPGTQRDRYRELLREHGHLVPREPGDDGNLPCGWPAGQP